MRSRLIILHGMLLAILIAAWRAGLFASLASISPAEITLTVAVGVYGAIGLIAAVRGRWETARHLANGAPRWALVCTVIGLALAVTDLHALTPAALAVVFREMAYAIIPNAVAVSAMSWIRELAYWCAGEDV